MEQENSSVAQLDAPPNSFSRVNTAAVERALAGHPAVSEVVVVPAATEPDRQVLTAFVTLKPGFSENETLRHELAECARNVTGSEGVPERFCFAPSLPKTRSGKIMRDLLEEMASQ